MRTGSYSLEPARSYPPEARRSSSERSSALRPPGERSRPSQREFPKPVREQQPDSCAPELPLLAEMCNTGSQLVKKSRALFPAPKAGLHCDIWSDVDDGHTAGTFPSSKSWAPLRRYNSRVAKRSFFSFSQLQKLGSIATYRPSSNQSLVRSFPSSKSWAPLRRHVDGAEARGPASFSQLQKLGSIATPAVTRTMGTGPSLFPAPKAGLHCDEAAETLEQRRYWTFPSSKSWAPLRHGVRSQRLHPTRLFPAPKAGLHCD